MVWTILLIASIWVLIVIASFMVYWRMVKKVFEDYLWQDKSHNHATRELYRWAEYFVYYRVTYDENGMNVYHYPYVIGKVRLAFCPVILTWRLMRWKHEKRKLYQFADAADKQIAKQNI